MAFIDVIWLLNSLQNSTTTGRDFKPLNPNIMKVYKIILIMVSTTICIISISCMDRDSYVTNEADLPFEKSSLVLKRDSVDSKEIIIQDPPPKDRDNWRAQPSSSK